MAERENQNDGLPVKSDYGLRTRGINTSSSSIEDTCNPAHTTPQHQTLASAPALSTAPLPEAHTSAHSLPSVTQLRTAPTVASKKRTPKRNTEPKAAELEPEPEPQAPLKTRTKRIKGARFTRNFIIGSEAWPLDPTNRPEGIPADHTTGWRVYVKSLFHTYANSLRTVEEPGPFEVRETGWGGFQVEVRLHFNPVANEKPQWRSHYLQLEPYGTDEEKAAQKAAGLVRAEQCDVVEFNEPTEALFEVLTSESQFDYLRQGNGRGGGGKGRKSVGGGVEEVGSAELPERPTPGNPYSRQMEDQEIAMLRLAEEEVGRLLEAENKRRVELEARLAELSWQ
ncbi:NuA4 histone H4 acetyltransferase complex and the SWR1 complex subunit [Coniosporium tulheliwenetii]|uniref:NuA4 histone H4 acetyltransferase complex and the SWR1 complex subunit n=1 Tax=Coniosporium tulheliwenetii TaxID=3383036 RepID=A0ACC2ZDG9_9PEZI|nr:NuA4 histone H4 acetyltransferase complex and the SWR1 complex subunit [Cladosporium sp. JES 115]